MSIPMAARSIITLTPGEVMLHLPEMQTDLQGRLSAMMG
jgi:hypothetical protein